MPNIYFLPTRLPRKTLWLNFIIDFLNLYSRLRCFPKKKRVSIEYAGTVRTDFFSQASSNSLATVVKSSEYWYLELVATS